MILALDPGKTTGWARFHADAGTGVLIDAGQCGPIVAIQKILEEYRYEVVIVENFRVRPRTAPWGEVVASERIGAIEYICQHVLHPSPVVVRQEPSQRVKVRTEAHRSKHARDAIGHAIAYLLKQGFKVHDMKQLMEERRCN